MELEFTANALARMAERGVRTEQVRAALEAPDQLAPCLEKLWQARKALEGRRLEVVFARDLALALVMTVYWQELS
jgi:hypothetical protein